MERILVCLDRSPRAAHVLDVAIDLARRTSARLVLFRVAGLPPDIAHEDIIGVSPNDLATRIIGGARQDLMRFAERVPTELLAAADVKLGSPWDAICTAAVTEKADLVMIGSHGYGTLDRLLGTTAAKVVNHAPCSVMVVR